MEGIIVYIRKDLYFIVAHLKYVSNSFTFSSMSSEPFVKIPLNLAKHSFKDLGRLRYNDDNILWLLKRIETQCYKVIIDTLFQCY